MTSSQLPSHVLAVLQWILCEEGEGVFRQQATTLRVRATSLCRYGGCAVPPRSLESLRTFLNVWYCGHLGDMDKMTSPYRSHHRKRRAPVACKNCNLRKVCDASPGSDDSSEHLYVSLGPLQCRRFRIAMRELQYRHDRL